MATAVVVFQPEGVDTRKTMAWMTAKRKGTRLTTLKQGPHVVR
jgi:hypothetical protein